MCYRGGLSGEKRKNGKELRKRGGKEEKAKDNVKNAERGKVIKRGNS